MKEKERSSQVTTNEGTPRAISLKSMQLHISPSTNRPRPRPTYPQSSPTSAPPFSATDLQMLYSLCMSIQDDPPPTYNTEPPGGVPNCPHRGSLPNAVDVPQAYSDAKRGFKSLARLKSPARVVDTIGSLGYDRFQMRRYMATWRCLRF